VYRVLSTAGATHTHPYTYLSMHYTYVPICTYLYRVYIYMNYTNERGVGRRRWTGYNIYYVNTAAGGRWGVPAALTHTAHYYVYRQALLNACVYTHNPQAALQVTYLFNARARISFGSLSRSPVPVPPPCESRAAVRRGRKYFKNSYRTPENRPLQLHGHNDVWKTL